jgi:hypothetical protein
MDILMSLVFSWRAEQTLRLRSCCPLIVENLISLVFSWSARQTWRRGASNAERAPPPFLNSLAALQGWQNCPQIGHRERQERRCSVSAQRWSAGVTPPPLIARTNRKRLLLSPNKCSRIVSLFCMPHVIAAHAVIKSPLIAFHQTPKTPLCQKPHCVHTAFHASRSHLHTSHVARLVLFTHHRKQLLSQFVFVFRILTPVSSVAALATF